MKDAIDVVNMDDDVENVDNKIDDGKVVAD